MATEKDKDELVLNPVSGQLDMVRIFNPNRIVTAQNNAAGNPRMTYDSVSNTQIADGPTVVVDENGNVVVI